MYVGYDDARYDEICSIDPRVTSQGFFENGMQDILGYSLPRLQLQLSLIFILTQSLHLLFKRFNFPRSFSEIMVRLYSHSRSWLLLDTYANYFIDLL